MSDEPRPAVEQLAEQLGSEVGREAGPKLLELSRARLLDGASKPGPQTSEFRMAALALLIGAGMVGLGVYAEEPELRAEGVRLIQVAVGAYAGARGLAKLGAGASKPQPPADR